MVRAAARSVDRAVETTSRGPLRRPRSRLPELELRDGGATQADGLLAFLLGMHLMLRGHEPR
jgi:hypothetical protein